MQANSLKKVLSPLLLDLKDHQQEGSRELGEIGFGVRLTPFHAGNKCVGEEVHEYPPDLVFGDFRTRPPERLL